MRSPKQVRKSLSEFESSLQESEGALKKLKKLLQSQFDWD